MFHLLFPNIETRKDTRSILGFVFNSFRDASRRIVEYRRDMAKGLGINLELQIETGLGPTNTL